MYSNPIKLTRVCAALICVLGAAALANPAEGRTSVVQQKPDAAVLNAEGLELYKSGKYEEAVKLFKEALKLKKDYAEAHSNLGNAYYQLHQFKKAIEEYKQLLKSEPNSLSAYNHIGLAYFALRDHKKAIEAYNEALRIDPKSSFAIFHLGEVYADQEKQKEALAQYEILKSLDAAQAKQLYLLIFKPVAPVFSTARGVTLNIVVTDAQDNPVVGLNKDDFQVFEEDASQVITSFSQERYPVLYALAIDTSGSMRPAFKQELDLVRTIIQNTQSEDEIFLERFVSSDKIETVQEFTKDRNILLKWLDTLYIEGGQSAILDAIYLAAQRTAEYKVDSTSYLRRVVILITDGDERASYYSINELVGMLRQIDVQIFAICLSRPEGSSKLNQILPKSAEPLLMKLAKETGGRAFFPKTDAELNTVVEQLMAMVRTEYLLTYKPIKPAITGTFQRINVTVTNKGGTNTKAWFRSSYIIPETKPMPPR